MRYAEVLDMIDRSSAEEWNHIGCLGSGAGPSYKNVFYTWDDHKHGLVTGVDSFPNHAVYKEDVNLSMAWGLDRDERHWESNRMPLSFDFSENFPDTSVSVFFADVFWAGTLVERRYLISVDGGRCALPMPQVRKTTEESGRGFEEVLISEDLPLARLLHGLEGTDDFDHYVRASGLRIESRR